MTKETENKTDGTGLNPVQKNVSAPTTWQT